MDRAQKQEAIEALKGVFDGAGAVVVTHYMGLTVAEMTDLRGRLRVEGAQLQVVKNTLVQKALNGSVGEAGDALFKGPVAIAYARTLSPPPRSQPSMPRTTRSSPLSAA
jgi:large subunit ribosomal protein L10